MLFERNQNNRKDLLPEMVKGQRAIVARTNGVTIKDDNVISDEVCGIVGIATADGDYPPVSFIAWVEVCISDYPGTPEEYLKELDSKRLQAMGVERADREPWTDEQIDMWHDLICDQVVNVYQNYSPSELITKQLNLLVGGTWGYVEEEQFVFYFDAETVGDAGDDPVEEIVGEACGKFDEWVSYDKKHVVHVYESDKEWIADIEDLKRVIYWAVEGSIDSVEILLDEEMADDILRDRRWDTGWFSGLFDAEDLIKKLKTGGYYDDDELWIMIAGLVKAGVNITI